MKYENQINHEQKKQKKSSPTFSRKKSQISPNSSLTFLTSRHFFICFPFSIFSYSSPCTPFPARHPSPSLPSILHTLFLPSSLYFTLPSSSFIFSLSFLLYPSYQSLSRTPKRADEPSPRSIAKSSKRALPSSSTGLKSGKCHSFYTDKWKIMRDGS